MLGSSVLMATPERALLDALDRPRFAGGIREVARIVAKGAKRVSWERGLDLAGRWDESALVQRLGYLVDLHRIDLPRTSGRRFKGSSRPRARSTWVLASNGAGRAARSPMGHHRERPS